VSRCACAAATFVRGNVQLGAGAAAIFVRGNVDNEWQEVFSISSNHRIPTVRKEPIRPIVSAPTRIPPRPFPRNPTYLPQ